MNWLFVNGEYGHFVYAPCTRGVALDASIDDCHIVSMRFINISVKHLFY